MTAADRRKLAYGIALARRLSKLTQPWHPRRYSTTDLHRTTGVAFESSGVGLRHAACGVAIGVAIEHETDPDHALIALMSEPPGGRNHGRLRRGPRLETAQMEGTLEGNGMFVTTLPTGNPVGRPSRKEPRPNAVETLRDSIAAAHVEARFATPKAPFAKLLKRAVLAVLEERPLTPTYLIHRATGTPESTIRRWRAATAKSERETPKVEEHNAYDSDPVPDADAAVAPT